MDWSDKIYFQDAIEVRCDSVRETKDRLKRKASVHVDWSYEPTRKIIQKTPDGGLSFKLALGAASALKLDIARKNNCEAVELLHPVYSALPCRFYPLERERFKIAPDISFPLRMLGLLHNGDIGTLHWAQFRKNKSELPFYMAYMNKAIQMEYVSDPEYENCNVCLVDISVGEGNVRQLNVVYGDKLPNISEKEIEDFLDPVARAIRELRSEGFQPAQRPKKPRADDSRQPGLL